jgi:hypothetical protein
LLHEGQRRAVFRDGSIILSFMSQGCAKIHSRFDGAGPQFEYFMVLADGCLEITPLLCIDGAVEKLIGVRFLSAG